MANQIEEEAEEVEVDEIATITGYVIQDAGGAYLHSERFWQDVSPDQAFVHPFDTIETLRNEFRHGKNSPTQMAYAVRTGGRTVVNGPIVSFYPATDSTKATAGDCTLLGTQVAATA